MSCMQTWDEVEKSIRETFEAIAEGRQDYAILSLEGTDGYVQWTTGAWKRLRVEVSSNEVLETTVLSAAALERLSAVGVDLTPDPNYIGELADLDQAVELVIRVLREVFQVQPVEVKDIEVG